MAGLREEQQGALLLAVAYGIKAPFSEADAAELEHELGIPVVAERRCVYAPNLVDLDQPVRLWDLLFGDVPVQRVQEGASQEIEISGRKYLVTLSAWARSRSRSRPAEARYSPVSSPHRPPTTELVSCAGRAFGPRWDSFLRLLRVRWQAQRVVVHAARVSDPVTGAQS